ncbi:transposable element Tcb2 transposase [Trichonephila clavipes]|nr:transposable element Tcb2 transposase [Trichonephila clavipes]
MTVSVMFLAFSRLHCAPCYWKFSIKLLLSDFDFRRFCVQKTCSRPTTSYNTCRRPFSFSKCCRPLSLHMSLRFGIRSPQRTTAVLNVLIWKAFAVHKFKWRVYGRLKTASQSNTVERHSYILVWAGISLGGHTDLHVYGGTVTGLRYRDEILDPYVRPYAAAIGNDFILMDDNARPHRAIVDITVWNEWMASSISRPEYIFGTILAERLLL